MFSFRQASHYNERGYNLLVNEIGTTHNNSKFQYKINGQSYIVPNIGFQIKLWEILYYNYEIINRKQSLLYAVFYNTL